ncbi:putative Ntn-hydrolase superfamily protein [Rhodoligotrophos appendicifer]|uniref:DUF1028 domain-containing protein n=1 Tax=Rhodoligotrophos appendicifer TaxID=987056 RepID=UPI00118699A8|nr:DUF1028 domain-containing protein [Rhodoligotrophos appendicifer]
MTFSVSGRCARTGMFGIAVSSSSPCVAARCAHARAGVGAVATQNITDPTLGRRGLDLMQSGLSAAEALEKITADAPHIAYRQLALIDSRGQSAGYSGDKTLGLHAVAKGTDVIAAGNLLAVTAVPQAMVAAFEASAADDLGDRLIAAMQAGLDAGGEEGTVHSAGMLLVDKVEWPVADLRLDWHETDPIGSLAELWHLWKPQMRDYITRALDPGTAPTYGVPGDL